MHISPRGAAAAAIGAALALWTAGCSTDFNELPDLDGDLILGSVALSCTEDGLQVDYSTGNHFNADSYLIVVTAEDGTEIFRQEATLEESGSFTASLAELAQSNELRVTIHIVNPTLPTGELSIPVVTQTIDVDGDDDGAPGIGCGGVDCDDGDASVFPGAAETCNSKDDDCNGVPDDNLPEAPLADLQDGVCAGVRKVCTEGGGFVEPPYGELVETFTEGSDAVCDGLDNDCDGSVDEDVMPPQDDDPCTVTICNSELGMLEDVPASDGTACDDGEFCTVDDVCGGGECRGGAARDCGDVGDVCNEGVCNEDSDACEASPFPAGVPCEDGLFCNGPEACDGAGSCAAGDAPVIDDGVGCTNDSCDEENDVVVNAADDANCDDGLFCNGAETCDAQADCQAGAAPEIDDGVACTNDSCDEDSDVVVNVAADANCDDGAFCNGAETCDAVNDCQAGVAPEIDDGVDCTNDSCDEDNDVVVNAVDDGNCDDGAFCNGAETCDAVSDCQAGVAPEIDDGVECTNDSCDEDNDVVVNAADDGNCDDGLFCNGAETCDPVNDCQVGVAPEIDDGVDCTDDSCDEDNDVVVNAVDDSHCDDGLFCNGAETCDSANDCQAGTPPTEDDGVDCTVDACEEDTDSFSHTPDDGLCDDGAFCNGAESCDAVNDCQAGVAPEIDDGVDCTVDSCDEDDDVVVNAPDDGRCDNGVFCDGAEACVAGVGCEDRPDPVIDDGVGCTVDICDEDNDVVVNTPTDANCDDGAFCNGAETCDAVNDCQAGVAPEIDDGVSCTVDSCDEENDVVVNAVDDSRCVDEIGCTVDSCHPTEGCQNLPDAAACDDGAFCNGVEICDPLTDCGAGEPPNTDDGIDCTVDSCDEDADVVVNAPSDALCDDSVGCTENTCDAAQGCVFVPQDAACDDGAFCNGAETCDAQNDCQAGVPPVLDDEIDCTDDSCDEDADIVVHTPNSGLCDDSVGCTENTCDAAQGCVFVPQDAACDDGAFCNGPETCDAQNDCQAGIPPVLDDQIDCTDDSCDEDADAVVHAPNNGLCDDSVGCTDNTCDPAQGCVFVPQDAACDDGAFCNGPETCDAQNDCQAGIPPVLDDEIDCTDDSCDEDADAVVHAPNDGLCDDSVGCTDNTCDPAQGCVFVPQDAACDDGAFCNGPETCDAQSDCQAGIPPVLDDEIDCTDDSCDEDADTVVHAPNDGLCDDSVGCTTNACDAAQGCVFAPQDQACDDGLFCNGPETCDAQNDCQAGVPPVLDDGVGCTVDSCDEDADVVVHATDDSLCDDSVACTNDSCNATLDCIFTPVNANCDDGLFCNGPEQCDLENDCQAGTPPVVDDQIDCTVDSCDEDADVVVNAPDAGRCDDSVGCTTNTCDPAQGCVFPPDHGACDDGLFCNGPELCDPENDCQVGVPPVLDDEVDCTVDSCDEDADVVVNAPDDSVCGDNVVCTTDVCLASIGCVSFPEDVACDDGEFCNGAERCDATQDCIAGTPPVVDDGVDCTVDACDEVLDVVSHTPDHAVCVDAAACTVDQCDVDLGCVFDPDDSACDDGLFCNGAEVCAGGANCEAGDAPVLDDGNPCTIDACDEDADTVTHTADDGACDDGNPCTVDTCDALLGCLNVPDNSLCDDGVDCTVDSCDLQQGCTNAADDSFCDDGELCNGAETCDVDNDCVAGVQADDGTSCGDGEQPCSSSSCAAGSCVVNDRPDCTPCGGGQLCAGGACGGVAANFIEGFEGGTMDGPFVASLVTGGDQPFTVGSAVVFEGNFAARSGAIGNGQSSFLELTLPLFPGGSLNFRYRSDTEPEFDVGRVLVNGELDLSFSGQEDWTQHFINLPGGTHVIRIEYRKDGSLSVGDDAIFIDRIQLDGYGPAACADGEFCSFDLESPAGGCVVCPFADGAACDDGDACTLGEVCGAGSCGSGQARDCSDGLFCNGVETCDSGAGCLAGPLPPIDDGEACTIDSCDEENDVIVRTADHTVCDDGELCNGAETCDLEVGCLGGTPLADGEACNDDNDCTSETCQGGACTAAPVADCLSCEGGAGLCGEGECLLQDIFIGFEVGESGPQPSGNESDADWFIDDSQAHSGSRSLRSGTIDHGQASEAELEVTLAEEGSLSFWFRADAEAGEFTGLLIDDEFAGGTPGDGAPDWTLVEVVLDAGTHTLLWFFEKDDSLSTGADAVWIDDIQITGIEDLSCDDGESCTENLAAVSGCIVCAAADGTGCSDGSDCTTGDVCQSGTCAGVASQEGSACADDANECTTDLCDDSGNCAHAAVGNCAPCDGDDFCVEGACGGVITDIFEEFEDSDQLPPEFSDGGTLGWTIDTNEARDGDHSAVNVDIGNNQSTSMFRDVTLTDAGEVAFDYRTETESCCDHLEFYVDGVRELRVSGFRGWEFTSVALDAGDHSLEWRYRKDGSVSSGRDSVWVDNVEVTGIAPPCDDDNDCTADYSDGNACTTCNEPQGVLCDDGNECTSPVGACDGAGGCVAAALEDGLPCGDEGGFFCVSGVCTEAPNCDDDNPCTVDNFGLGGCTHDPVLAGVICDDGLFCNGVERCDGAGTCAAGTPPEADDGINCTVAQCDEDTDSFDFVAAPELCDDGDACTTDECNLNFGCLRTPVSCDDGDVCTVDSCTDVAGVATCGNVPAADGSACPDEDGNECTVNTCQAGACVVGNVADGTDCTDDGNECTTTSCQGGACTPVPLSDSTPCSDDGNECTTDFCDGAGACAHPPAAASTECTDDGNECTIDFCDGAGGCVHPPLPTNVPCTDDGNVCTFDSCDGAGGCGHTPVTDGLDCDEDDTDCVVESCQTGTCAATPVDDCSACGENGEGLCAGGSCGGVTPALVFDFESADLPDAITVGNPGWFRDDDNPGDGEESFASEGIDSDEEAFFEIDVTLTDPGELSFLYRVSSEQCCDFLEVYVDDQPIFSESDSEEWQRFTAPLDAGAHTLVFTYVKDGSVSVGEDRAVVDDIRITGVGGCADALCNVTLFDGNSCIECAAPDGEACPGDECVGAAFCVDGRCLGQPADPGTPCSEDDGNACTTQACDGFGSCAPVPIADGSDCDVDPNDCTTDSCVAGDCVAVNLADCEACGADGVGRCASGECAQVIGDISADFENDDLAPLRTESPAWFVDDQEAFESLRSARSADITHNQDTSIFLDVSLSDSGTLAFDYRVESESCCDHLELYIDGAFVDQWSNSPNWQREEVFLPAGDYAIEWRYDKDGSVNGGADAAWIDNVLVSGVENGCDDGLPCNLDLSSSDGSCSYCPDDEGSACSDDNECTAEGVCTAGDCVLPNLADGTPCTPDEDVCTADVCLDGACTHDVSPDGTPCSGPAAGGGVGAGCEAGNFAGICLGHISDRCMPRNVSPVDYCGDRDLRPITHEEFLSIIAAGWVRPDSNYHTMAVVDELDTFGCGDGVANVRIPGFGDANSLWNCGATQGYCSRSTLCVSDRLKFCDAGVCTDHSECDDGNPCTEDSWNGQCVNTPVEDGLECGDDNNECTIDTCVAGQCHTPVADQTACDRDGDSCTIDVCLAGACKYDSDVDCDDGEACTVDACDSGLGCQNQAFSCEDDNSCTTDTCVVSNEGVAGCDFSAIAADEPCESDDKDCTVDVCDGAGSCTHPPVEAGVACNDGDACTEAEACDGTGFCVGTPIDCDDGLFCNGAEGCDPDFGCFTEVPTDTDDGIDCTVDSCDEELDLVINEPQDALCDDGELCTGIERCSPLDDCLEGAPPPDGTLCDEDDQDCLVESCQDGACRADPLPDCSDCADGAGQCAFGECQSTTESVTEDFESGSFGPAFSTRGDGDWSIVVDAAGARAGEAYARSPQLGDSEDAELVLTVNLAFDATLSFWHRESTESCCDELQLYFDGVFIREWAQENGDWTFDSVAVPAGTSEIAFRYDKDGSVSRNDDAVYLDDIRIGPPEHGCDDLADCTVDLPGPEGACVFCPRPDGDACQDDCTEAGTCADGDCVAAPVADGLVCTDDENECTSDLCLDGDCSHLPVDDGTLCGDSVGGPGAGSCDEGRFAGVCLGHLSDNCMPRGVSPVTYCEDRGMRAITHVEFLAVIADGWVRPTSNYHTMAVVDELGTFGCGDGVANVRIPGFGDANSLWNCGATQSYCSRSTLCVSASLDVCEAGFCTDHSECIDDNPCTDDGWNGVCQNPPSAAGQACEPDAPLQSCQAASCDGTGTCAVSDLPEGSACEFDGSVPDCMAPQCDASGSCVLVPRAAGAECADAEFGECSDFPAFCDGAGVCVAPPLPAGTECGIVDQECRISECSVDGACLEVGPAPDGTDCEIFGEVPGICVDGSCEPDEAFD